MNHNSGAADQFGHLLGLSRLLTGNIIEGMKVTQAGSANMTVLVSNGSGVIPAGTYPTSYSYFIAATTSGGESVTITTANTSNPRIDTIVAYVNESATYTTSPVNNPGAWVAAAVAGTPAGTPSAPSGATIQSAIGAGNPYIVLANVLVGANVTSIVNSNITDLRAFVTGPPVCLAYAEGLTTGQSTGSTSYIDATGITITFTAPLGCTNAFLHAEVPISGDTSGANILLAITDSSNTIQVERYYSQPAANTNLIGTVPLSRRISVTPGTSYTFKLRFAATGGNIVINQNNDSNRPTVLWADRA